VLSTVWNEPQFDNHQFEKRARAVSVNTGISYQDYRAMHVEHHAAKRERRLENPNMGDK